MIIQNIHNGVKNEVSKEQWKALGPRQKIFRILDEKDSKEIKDQVIANNLGKKIDPKKLDLKKK